VVVLHHRFPTATRALGVPKSRVSRHVALLEERLGVRLLDRQVPQRREALAESGIAGDLAVDVAD
jgi:DNA-binding transcriptional LysR family regulator